MQMSKLSFQTAPVDYNNQSWREHDQLRSNFVCEAPTSPSPRSTPQKYTKLCQHTEQLATKNKNQQWENWKYISKCVWSQNVNAIIDTNGDCTKEVRRRPAMAIHRLENKFHTTLTLLFLPKIRINYEKIENIFENVFGHKIWMPSSIIDTNGDCKKGVRRRPAMTIHRLENNKMVLRDTNKRSK